MTYTYYLDYYNNIVVINIYSKIKTMKKIYSLNYLFDQYCKSLSIPVRK